MSGPQFLLPKGTPLFLGFNSVRFGFTSQKGWLLLRSLCLSPGYQRHEPVAQRSCSLYSRRKVRNVSHSFSFRDAGASCSLRDAQTAFVSLGKAFCKSACVMGMSPEAGSGASSTV